MDTQYIYIYLETSYILALHWENLYKRVKQYYNFAPREKSVDEIYPLFQKLRVLISGVCIICLSKQPILVIIALHSKLFRIEIIFF